MRFVTLLLLLITCQTFAQDDAFFRAIPDNESVRENYAALVKSSYENEVDAISSKYKSDLKEFYKYRYEKLKNFAKDSLILADVDLEKYLQSIVKEIVSANPELRLLPVHVHLSRQWWANAACFGDGTIFINIGLLSRLHTEAELAFVIAHEIAHQYRNHVNEDVLNYLTLVNSKEFQREISVISRMEYGRNTALKELAKDISFDDKLHSRKHEFEADKLANKWLTKTRYDESAAKSCLLILDSIDTYKYNFGAETRKFFNFPEYPYQDDWDKKPENFFSQLAMSKTDEEKVLADSLKTHPECQKRILALSDITHTNGISSKKHFVFYDSLQFKQLTKQMDYELIRATYRQYNICKSLLYTLQMIQAKGLNPYLATHTGVCLNAMYKSQKEHKLGTITRLPSPDFEKKYNDLLEFIQRLRLDDIGNIAYYFMRMHAGEYASYKPFREAFDISRKHINK